MRSSAFKRFPVSTSSSSPLASTSRLQNSSSNARGYATCSEEAPDIDPSIYNKKVDMSVIEKGKGYYINYKKLDENIKIVRQR
jgi:aconitate hydratase